ncbi:hypothetical protein [Streptomyces sp. GESEQ-35]|uniref:hypothetical protein n=1 Tax=Streptomyces sp. GESEQ-35 TaxID=2812657 RepID=UPI001B326120|nr:hypothetical protein [Streptomyces sp. GESEQ-35]
MSVLQFISSVKWPLLILILVAFSWWRLRKNPVLAATLQKVLEGRSVRISLAGQEVELTRVEEAAAIAASSDAEIIRAATTDGDGEGGLATDEIDVVQFRRAAVEQLMARAAEWGWNAAREGFRYRPRPAIKWNLDGQPEIGFATGTIENARLEDLSVHMQTRMWRPSETDE